MKKIISLVLAVLMLLGMVVVFSSCGEESEYDASGRMKLSLRNLYFTDWTGGDAYTEYIEEKFNVAITPSSYSWADWDSQVYGPVNSDNLTDVFHFDVDSYNFANSYQTWVKGLDIKALPDDLSKWPNLQNLINSVSNVENLKIDGKLYCIPLVKNIESTETTYSPFTYVYRRDWAKELKVYQENDVYTWDQFIALLNAFYDNKCQSGDFIALADVEWGFPSVINFYKTAPHCFAEDGNSIVSNYTTSAFLQGLEKAKEWVSTNLYGYDQYAANEGDIAKQYYAGRVGVFYENLSLSNYSTLRKKVSERSEIQTKEQLDDATAIMKVMGPDGKYALEGGENWFSATFFSANISDEKMEKILDIMDWLLSEEGTMMATYGMENVDYEIDGSGNVVLLEAGWEKSSITGEYLEKNNGVKYLRYMCTLSYDTSANDPLVDADSLAILNDWNDYMATQLANGNLRILKENGDVKWLSTAKKSQHANSLLSGGNTAVINYVYGKTTKNDYLATFQTTKWNDVLNEINATVSK